VEPKAGTRFASVVDTTQVIVVRPSSGAADLRCGGHAMVPLGDETPVPAALVADEIGTQLGKRYVDEESGLEVLCTKAGPGSLAIGDRRLTIKGAKPLPSSD